jgi:AcrR family transcriptional regulator
MPCARNHSNRSLPPQEKRALILAAAGYVITRRGFDGAKMEDIAARAGVGKGTLYNFFSSKEDLFVSLVVDHFEQTRKRIDAEVAPLEDPWQRLEVAWRTLMLSVFPELVQQWDLNYQLWGVLARERRVRDRFFKDWRQMYRERERDIGEAIEQGQAGGYFRADVDPKGIALLLLSVFDGLLHRAMFDARRIDPQETLEDVLSLVRGMLAPPANGDGKERP